MEGRSGGGERGGLTGVSPGFLVAWPSGDHLISTGWVFHLWISVLPCAGRKKTPEGKERGRESESQVVEERVRETQSEQVKFQVRMNGWLDLRRAKSRMARGVGVRQSGRLECFGVLQHDGGLFFGSNLTDGLTGRAWVGDREKKKVVGKVC